MCKIPTHLTEIQFKSYFDPYLSRGARGPANRLPRYQLFNCMLYWLHTGCQWYELPISAIVGSEKKRAVGKQSMFNSPGGAGMAVFSAFGSRAS
jgi:hypothetical protein